MPGKFNLTKNLIKERTEHNQSTVSRKLERWYLNAWMKKQKLMIQPTNQLGGGPRIQPTYLRLSPLLSIKIFINKQKNIFFKTRSNTIALKQ